MKQKRYNPNIIGKQMGSHGQKRLYITPAGRFILFVLFLTVLYWLYQRFL